jgi:hypothetical protein
MPVQGIAGKPTSGKSTNNLDLYIQEMRRLGYKIDRASEAIESLDEKRETRRPQILKEVEYDI